MSGWHGAFIGMTGSGKTTAGRGLAGQFRQHRVGCIGLTPAREPWPELNWQTPDPDRFIHQFWRCERCAVFVEMSDASVAKNDDRFHKIFTQGRHQGHRVFLVSQRHTQVDPVIRESVHRLWLLKVGRKAATEWSEEFGDPALMAAADVTFPLFTYLYAARGLPAQRYPVVKID